ncbi:hypothetical protein [Neorhizobium sp. NCHU2750]|uniref:hypothetical protein n=1 Tax=Neorhizobium sp. NCHU2750 TaxID=1825976 RepID=UPI001968FA10
MLKALEAKAMITRVPCREPATAKRVEITSSGLASLRIAMPIAIGVQREMFGADGEIGGPLLCALRHVEIGE